MKAYHDKKAKAKDMKETIKNMKKEKKEALNQHFAKTPKRNMEKDSSCNGRFVIAIDRNNTILPFKIIKTEGVSHTMKMFAKIGKTKRWYLPKDRENICLTEEDVITKINAPKVTKDKGLFEIPEMDVYEDFKNFFELSYY